MAMLFNVLALGVITSLIVLTPVVIQNSDKNDKNENNEKNEGSFSILSYNVAGLPELISSSHPIIYTKQISPKLNKYDVVNVQENFAYNKDLNSKLNFKYKTEYSGNVPLGDGLMTFSKYPLYMFDRITWKDSHGFIVNGADSMTKKGFTFTSMEIKSGYFIDIYNLHTDANHDEKSTEARNANMAQLADYIKGISEGKAVIIFGDTNSLYTDKGDKFYDLVVKTCNLKDAWIENVMEGKIPEKGDRLDPEKLGQKGEVLDKIWYRSGKNIEIEATSFEILFKEFTTEKGEQLSDHYPVTSNIKYKLIEGILTSDIYGEINGKGFSFIEKIESKYPLNIIISTSDKQVIKIGFTYKNNGTFSVGGNGGNEKKYEFKEGEYIVKMTISKDRKNIFSPYYISYISLTTNLNNVISGGKLKLFNQKTFESPKGYAISGFIGYSSDVINKLGCIYQKI